MKKKLLYGAVGLAVVVVIGFIFRDYIIRQVYTLVLKPRAGFEEIAQPPAPDYSLEENWAALPARQDNADVVPARDAADRQDEAAVDVFFLHPTTYYSRKSWNQPLDDEGANDYTDRRVLRHQASAFNGSGRVYAPRYRQATLYSFMDKDGNGTKALELAYGDVRKAFEYYVDHYNEGRPIIVASHSQGSRHGMRLLEDYFSEEPLRSRLVAAYLVGWSRTPPAGDSDVAGIPLCESPDQTGCWLTWNTVGPKAERRPHEKKDAVCVNPLTWTTDGGYAAHELNLGGIVFPDKQTEPPEPDVAITCGQCVEGRLVISRPEADGYSYMPMGRDNYHIYDYNLFYMNIRQNVQERVAAYLQRLPDAVAD